MTSSTFLDRINGVQTSIAIKAQVRVATTANITLSGEQTIDDIAVVANDRVLVWNQTDTTENGIYDAAISGWTRSIDFNGTRDAAEGTLIWVVSGTTHEDTFFQLTTTDDPIVFGTSSITFDFAVFGLGQIQSEGHIWCGAMTGTANAGVLTPNPAFSSYKAGQRLRWMASANSNTTAMTVAVSGLPAIAVQNDGAALIADDHTADKMYEGYLNTTSTMQITRVRVSEPFVQEGTGAVPRTAQAKMREFVSTFDFMTVAEANNTALGIGSIDVTAAVQAALTAAVAASKPLRGVAGRYLMSAQLTSSSANPCTIVGDGSGVCEFLWTDTATAGGGIAITYTDKQYAPAISGLTLLTQAAGATDDTALKITGPNVSAAVHFGPKVTDVYARGDNTANDYWDIGIEWIDCWYVMADRISIKGQDGVAPFNMSTGLKFSSCTVMHITNFGLFHMDTGMLETIDGASASHGEGIHFADFEIVGVGTGIDFTVGGAANGNSIGPGHINAYDDCIKLTDQRQLNIHDNLLYKVHVSSSTWAGIRLVDCQENTIHHNTISGQGPANLEAASISYGIIASGTGFVRNTIDTNTFVDMDTGSTKLGILLSTGCSDNLVLNNRNPDGSVTAILTATAADPDNIFFKNLPITAQVLTDADTTPSVGNALDEVFATSNTGATTITTFDDGYTGQIINVFVGDANTTFQHSGTAGLMHLQGLANFVAGAGAFLTLRWDGVRWREMSRRT